MPYFQLQPKALQQLKEQASTLLSFSTDKDQEDQMEQVVDFLQNEVRYLGFEEGLNAYQPHHPLKVLQQRFGACKDKSWLLSSILRALGVEAYPVLVNTTKGKRIEEELPSPHIFDHCVVLIHRQGQYYGIDPTMNHQKGMLQKRYFPYEKGLVLTKGFNQLMNLPAVQTSKTNVEEHFVVEKVDENATMDVKTAYLGAEADFQRSYFAANSLSDIQRNYLNFYSNQYPDIKANQDIRFYDEEDSTGQIAFIVEESYTIPKIWQSNKEKEGQVYVELYPSTLKSIIDLPASTQRTMPYDLNHPSVYEHKTLVSLPEAWHVKNEAVTLENDFFQYTNRITYHDQTLEINHQYHTLKDHVPTAYVSSFLKKHHQIQEHLSYYLTYTPATSGTFSFSKSRRLLRSS